MKNLKWQMRTSGLVPAGLLLCALLSVNTWAEPGSKDGTSSATESVADTATHVAQNGRATLTVNDLKTVLENGHSESSTAAEFFVNMTAHEKRILAKKIQTLQAKHDQTVAKVEKEFQLKKQNLRNDRKGIQSSRLTARNEKEPSLNKNLYESLLEEANLEAKKAKELSDCAANNSVSLDFVEINGQKHIESIQIGQAKVWTSTSAFSVAQIQ